MRDKTKELITKKERIRATFNTKSTYSYRQCILPFHISFSDERFEAIYIWRHLVPSATSQNHCIVY